MAVTMWAIVKGGAIKGNAFRLRSDAIDDFVLANCYDDTNWRYSESYIWKQWRRDGYRAVKVRVEEIK